MDVANELRLLGLPLLGFEVTWQPAPGEASGVVTLSEWPRSRRCWDWDVCWRILAHSKWWLLMATSWGDSPFELSTQVDEFIWKVKKKLEGFFFEPLIKRWLTHKSSWQNDKSPMELATWRAVFWSEPELNKNKYK